MKQKKPSSTAEEKKPQWLDYHDRLGTPLCKRHLSQEESADLVRALGSFTIEGLEDDENPAEKKAK